MTNTALRPAISHHTIVKMSIVFGTLQPYMALAPQTRQWILQVNLQQAFHPTNYSYNELILIFIISFSWSGMCVSHLRATSRMALCFLFHWAWIHRELLPRGHLRGFSTLHIGRQHCAFSFFHFQPIWGSICISNITNSHDDTVRIDLSEIKITFLGQAASGTFCCDQPHIPASSSLFYLILWKMSACFNSAGCSIPTVKLRRWTIWQADCWSENYACRLVHFVISECNEFEIKLRALFSMCS